MTFPLFFGSGPSKGDDGGDTTHRLDVVRPGISQPTPLERPQDADLVASVRAGDASAFESLFRAHHAALCEFAARYLRSMDAAEDAVDDVFAALWLRHAEWTPQAGVRAYLFGAVRNRTLTLIRDAGRRTVAGLAAARETRAEGELHDAVVGEAEERLTEVWAAVDALSERQRAVTTLRWSGGLSFEEIAAALSSTPAAVKMQFSRALRVLRARLARR